MIARPSRQAGPLTDVGLVSIGLFFQGLGRFLYTLAIGRFVGPSALADMTAVLSLSVLLALVLPAGIGIAAARFLPDPRFGASVLPQLRRWFWTASTLLAIAASAATALLLRDLLSALSCGLLVLSYNAYLFTRGTLLGTGRVLRTAVLDTLTSFAAIAGLAGVLLLGAQGALILPLCISYLLFAAFGRRRTQVSDNVVGDQAVIANFVRDASIGTFATGAILPASMVVVQIFESPTAGGIFAAALTLATPANTIAQAITQALIPRLARPELPTTVRRREFTRIFALSVVVFAVIFGVLIALAPLLIHLLYGDAYAAGTNTMRALLAIVFVISLTGAPAAFLIATDGQRTYARIWMVASGAGILLMIAASPALGTNGVLLGLILGGIGGSGVVIARALRHQPSTSDHDHLSFRPDTPRLPGEGSLT